MTTRAVNAERGLKIECGKPVARVAQRDHEMVRLVANLVRVPQRDAEQPFAARFQRNDVLARREHDLANCEEKIEGCSKTDSCFQLNLRRQHTQM